MGRIGLLEILRLLEVLVIIKKFSTGIDLLFAFGVIELKSGTVIFRFQ